MRISGFALSSQRPQCFCNASYVLQIARFGAIAICDSNRESRITSDLKGSALRFWCDLKRGSNHKSRDLNVRFAAICGKFLRFGLRDLKSLAICDLRFGALRTPAKVLKYCDRKKFQGRKKYGNEIPW